MKLSLNVLVILLFAGCCHGFWPFDKWHNGGAVPTRYPPLENKLSPVILIPGDGGSRIDAKVNKTSSPSMMCSKKFDWCNMWLNIELLIPPAVLCWIDNVKLIYNAKTRTTYNTPGVETRIPGWGDPDVVEWIDPTRNKAGAYFNAVANVLVGLGYKRLKNLHGAPYDFRKAPNENAQFFVDLKKLVEDSYERNGQVPVTFITHSMGSTMTLVFLQQRSLEWKQKYVKRQISLAGAWAGSVKALKVFAMGDDLDSHFLFNKYMRAEQITNPSSAWLLPSPLFWKKTEILVQSPDRVYTLTQLKDFFDDIDYPTGYEMRLDTLPYVENFSPPDIELHCLYGDGVPTIERLIYKKRDLTDETPELLKTNAGDGTVNRRSLQACQHWQGVNRASISSIAIQGSNHMDILVNPDVLTYIVDTLKKD